jgi:hypothetical protein
VILSKKICILGTFPLKGANLIKDITEIWYPPNFDVIPSINRLSKINFFSMDPNTCIVASLSTIINLESFKKHLCKKQKTMDKSFLSTRKFQMYFFV